MDSLKEYVKICKKCNIDQINNIIDIIDNHKSLNNGYQYGGSLESLYILKKIYGEDTKFKLTDIYHSYHYQNGGGIGALAKLWSQLAKNKNITNRVKNLSEKLPRNLGKNITEGLEKLSKDLSKIKISPTSEAKKKNKSSPKNIVSPTRNVENTAKPLGKKSSKNVESQSRRVNRSVKPSDKEVDSPSNKSKKKEKFQAFLDDSDSEKSTSERLTDIANEIKKIAKELE
jgi:hypothetical protein